MKKGNIKKLIFFSTVLLIYGCVQNKTLREPINTELKSAIVDGKILFDAYKEQQGNEKVNTAVQDARRKISDFCKLDYQPVVIEHPGKVIVYFIGDSDKRDELVFGRHYKVIGEKVIPSTESCVIMSPPPRGRSTAAPFITHLLSNFPTEFHVFLSLRYQKTIFVGTSSGTWRVEGTNVKKIK